MILLLLTFTTVPILTILPELLRRKKFLAVKPHIWKLDFAVFEDFCSYSCTKSLYFSRHASFPIVPKLMKKVRSWRSLESLVGVLRLRKCDKMRYFHRKKVCAHLICKTRSAIIKFLSISSQKQWKKWRVLNISHDAFRTNHWLPVKPYLAVRISIFNFLWT